MSVKVQNLIKTYGTQHAVNDITFEVDKGEVLGFLGPNGAGKSTTMKILTCFIPQTSGKAFVCGHDVEEDSMEARRKVGYLPESNPLYYDMYVREYLEFSARVYQIGDKKNRINDMIEMTGLGNEAHKKIRQLSKGYKQRVGLAQAMLHDPEVLILDEPTSGLDPNQLSEIRQLIQQMGKEKTVILSTHIMQEVEAICDRVIIINKGKLVADDRTVNLQQRVKGTTIVKVEFKEAVDEASLAAIDGVQFVQKTSGNNWTLTGKAQTDLRETVSKFAGEKGLTILSLHREESKLEDVFRELTTK